MRAALAMAALAAARANPALRAFRQGPRAAGKPHRVALTAVLRKLIVLANALIRTTASGRRNPLDTNTDGYACYQRDCRSTLRALHWCALIQDFRTQMSKEIRAETCGIVMPISEVDGCPPSHWAEVKTIISHAISEAGFEPNLVSSDADVGIIQKRIVDNLYNNPIVVCDISGRNANVMFELGIRLAFDKPVIIVKDDKTPYSFDTSPIEHLDYPRDLRFGAIVDFRSRLTEKVRNSINSKNSFLKSFGTFKVAELHEEKVGINEYVIEKLQFIEAAIARMSREQQKMTWITDFIRAERNAVAHDLNRNALSAHNSQIDSSESGIKALKMSIDSILNTGNSTKK